jgi:hypothetical protein
MCGKTFPLLTGPPLNFYRGNANCQIISKSGMIFNFGASHLGSFFKTSEELSNCAAISNVRRQENQHGNDSSMHERRPSGSTRALSERSSNSSQPTRPVLAALVNASRRQNPPPIPLRKESHLFPSVLEMHLGSPVLAAPSQTSIPLV